MAYMPAEEREAALAADPVPAFRRWLVDQGHFTAAQLGEVEERVEAEIDDAVAYALASPPPPASELFEDVYAVPIP
jgi:pyruvate dehydrogenase E1 component alpha subunit